MVTVIDEPHAEYLRGHDLGHLATVAPNGTPQDKPVGYRFDPGRQVIEIGGYDLERSAKFRNLALHPAVAFTVDDRPDPGAGAAGVRFLELRGDAEGARLDEPMHPGTGRWAIRLRPRRLVSYNIVGAGSFSADLGEPSGDAGRPMAGLPDAAARLAADAARELVDELQAGLEAGDAELYNRHFADDVMWGSPYGETVDGYDALHAIHRQLHSRGVAAGSRYEIVRVIAAAPDVALAQVRRRASSGGGFSEMALYALVRRAGRWWMAAGQNTIVDPAR
jgi:PPOX class F420-dependent enzyme/OxyR family protein/uncharacterized protein (TIGR02246 family)